MKSSNLAAATWAWVEIDRSFMSSTKWTVTAAQEHKIILRQAPVAGGLAKESLQSENKDHSNKILAIQQG